MSDFISSLVPPVELPARAAVQTRSSDSAGRRLPLPALVERRVRTTVYGLARVDDRGRVADRAIVRALGWTGDTRLTIRADAGRVVIVATAGGEYGLAGRERLHLPAPARRAAGIEPGDRVLLAAEPDEGRLVVHPPASLDAMLDTLPDLIGDGAG